MFTGARLKLASMLILVFLITFGIGAGLVGKFDNIFEESIESKVSKGKNVNVLVMGVDVLKGETAARSDTMLLASIDFNTKKVAMVWIPRDTRVQTAKGNNVKINSINFTHGPEEASKAVGDLLGTKVNYYMVVNFSAFEKLIDTLNGINMDVELNMRHYDPDPKLSISLNKGQQRLNGKQALDYVRYRGGPTADIGRTQRQQKFIKALAEEVLQAKTILKLPKIIPQIIDSVSTNIELNDMLKMVNVAKDFSADDLITQTLPGYPYTDSRSGASYWEVDRDIAKNIINDLFSGKTYDVAQDPPGWVSKPPQQVTVEVEREEETIEDEEISEGEEGINDKENKDIINNDTENKDIDKDKTSTDDKIENWEALIDQYQHQDPQNE